jgi:MFS transporter, DHA2 family, multidrug resistance protein
MFGSMYLLPVFAQTVLGYTAFKAGLLLMLSALLMIPIFPIGARFAQQPRSGIPIAVGMLTFGVSSLALARADTNCAFWLVAFWATFGRAGLGLALPSLQVGALRELSPQLLPYGAGTLNFVRMSGAAMGTGILANVLEHRTIVHNEQLFATQSERNTSTVELLDKVSSLLIEQGLSAAEQLPLAMHYLGKVITVQATGLAFKDGFLLLALCFLVAAVSALALTRAPSFQARPS